MAALAEAHLSGFRDMDGAFAYGQKSVRTLLLVKQRKSDRKEKTA